MGGRMKHVIVSITPLGRLLHIRCARADARFAYVSLYAQRLKSGSAPIIHPSFYGFDTAKRRWGKRARL